MRKKVLITGSEGFIGRAIKKVLSRDYKIIPFDLSKRGDILDKASLMKTDADIVIHLAACTKESNLEQMAKTNIIGTLNVLDYCTKNNAQLIFASSASVYGNVKSPITEEISLNPLTIYGETKKIGEDLCEFYHKKEGLDIVVLRIFNPYGRNQPRGFLIPDILSQLGEKEIKLKGNKNSKRDFVYIDDVAEAFKLAIGKKGFYVFNVGSGKGYSVEEIVRMITLKPIIAENTKKNTKTDIFADISKIKKVLGWEPRINLKEGIYLLKHDIHNRRCP